MRRILYSIIFFGLCAPTFPTLAGEVTVGHPKGRPIFKDPAKNKIFFDDLSSLAKKLVNNNDPDIEVVLLDSYNSTKRFIEIDEKGKTTLYINAGVFAFAKNINELAGVFSYYFSRLKAKYLERLDLALYTIGIASRDFADTKDLLAHLTTLLNEVSKNPKIAPDSPGDKNFAYYKNLRHAHKLALQAEKFNKRNFNLKETLSQTGVKLDLNGETQAAIEASKESVDRLIEGGFDPWGILSPEQRLVRLEEAKYGPISKFVKKRVGEYSDNSKTINSELEFIGNYLLYVEQKKVDITQQPFRGQPLTAEQSKVAFSAVLTQSVLLGPFIREVIGITGVAMTGTAVLYKGASKLSDMIKTPQNAALEPTEDTKNLEKYFDFFRSALDSTKELVSGALHTADRAIEKLPVVNDLAKKGVDAIHDPTIATSLFLGSALYLLSTPFRTEFTRHSAKFLYRYKENIKNQLGLSFELSKAHGKSEKSTAEIEQLSQMLEANYDFVSQGFEPRAEIYKSQLLYYILFEPKFFAPDYEIKKDDRSNLFKRLYKDARNDLIDELEKKKKRPLTEKEIKNISDSDVQKKLKSIAYDHFFKQSAPELQLLDSKQDDALDKAFSVAGKTVQRGLFRTFGSVATFLAEANTAALLKLIESKLQSGALSKADRANLHSALHTIKGMALFSKSVQEKYTELTSKYFDEFGSSPRHISLSIKSKTKPSSGSEAAETFNALMEQGLSLDAAIYLEKNLALLAEYPKHLKSEGERSHFTRNIDRLFNLEWDHLPKPFWSRRWLSTKILLKTMFINDPKARLALFSHLKSARVKGPYFLTGTVNKIYEHIYNKALTNAEDMQELLDHLDALKQEHNIESRYLLDFVEHKLKTDPKIITSPEDITRIVKTDYLWQKFLEARSGATSLEKQIIEKYHEYGKKYAPFTYDPSYSERLQRVLLARFKEIKPNAILEEKLDLWKQLASRGATGLTDELFEDLFRQITSSEKRAELAKEVLEQGLVWDQNIRVELYKVSENLSPNIIANKFESYRSSMEIQFSTLEKVRGPENRYKLDMAVADLLYKFETYFTFDSDAEKTRVANELKKAITHALKGKPGALDAWISKNRSALEQGLRRAEIDRALDRAKEAFPETGYGYISLLDWISSSFQTNQKEAYYIRDKIKNAGNENQDLGYATINEIVESALEWNKFQRWELIRWLRGTGEPPKALLDKLSRIGHGTLRRMYSTLPLFVRQSFMGTLLGAPGKGLLDGSSSALFNEQILNEILPADKESAKVAHDLLTAFLKSVEKISHPEKKKKVLSYLLANHAEGSNTGTVLRNVLEAYGVTGVKIGQLLAASDIMPEHIRKELTQLRDQSKEPFRHEIYERLSEITKQKNIDGLFSLKELKGAASIKYAVRIVGKDGKEHVIQIKREEAEAAISRDFKQLEIIFDDLLSKDAKKYAFLRGMVSATKAAIWRELSLVRESMRSDIATEEYSKIPQSDGVEVKIPQNTNLVEKLPGPKSKSFYLRSAEFAEGKNIEKLAPEKKADVAKAILYNEHELLFPADDRPTHFDPDRHPGNILISENKEGTSIQLQPIDWGQLLKLEPSQRNKIIRLISYTQLFELFGPTDTLFNKLAKEFGISKENAHKLQKGLFLYFPNKSAKPRSALAGYYYLLSEMEAYGFERAIVNYDFVKAIYQLEPYEAILEKASSTDHSSPKRTLAEKVEAEAKAISAGMKISDKEKFKYFVSHPIAALAANQNLENLKDGSFYVRQVFETIGISKATQDKFLEHLPTGIKTGEDFVVWLTERSKTLELSKAEKTKIETWRKSPTLEQTAPSQIPVKEYLQLASSTSVQNHMNKDAAENRAAIDQPKSHNFWSGAGMVFGGELVNAVFWGLWDKDKRIAKNWLREMMTIEKWAGFAAMSQASALYTTISNKTVPMSYHKTRWVNEHGLSMGVGMIAADMVRRIIKKQPIDQILDHEFSKANLKDVSFSTLGFMAAEKLVATSEKIAQKIGAPGANGCKTWYKSLGRMGLVFILAESWERNLRTPLTKANILTKQPLRELQEIGTKYSTRLQKKIDQVYQLSSTDMAGKIRLVFGSLANSNLHPSYYTTIIGNDGKLVYIYTICRPNLYTALEPDSILSMFFQYRKELDILEANTKDPIAVDFIKEETLQVRILTDRMLDELLQTQTECFMLPESDFAGNPNIKGSK